MNNKDRFNLLLLVEQVEEVVANQRTHYNETKSWHCECNCDECQILRKFHDLPLWKKWYGYYLYARKAIRLS